MNQNTDIIELSDSVFVHRPLEEIYDEIRKIYRQNTCPWVIGYSGGKDSTAVLQLVWYALADLPQEERSKPVYVLSSTFIHPLILRIPFFGTPWPFIWNLFENTHICVLFNENMSDPSKKWSLTLQFLMEVTRKEGL